MNFKENKNVFKDQEIGIKEECIKDYDLIKVLGEGAFAKVILVRKKINGKLYGMKAIHKKKIIMTEEDFQGICSHEELAYRNMYRVK